MFIHKVPCPQIVTQSHGMGDLVCDNDRRLQIRHFAESACRQKHRWREVSGDAKGSGDDRITVICHPNHLWRECKARNVAQDGQRDRVGASNVVEKNYIDLRLAGECVRVQERSKVIVHDSSRHEAPFKRVRLHIRPGKSPFYLGDRTTNDGPVRDFTRRRCGAESYSIAAKETIDLRGDLDQIGIGHTGTAVKLCGKYAVYVDRRRSPRAEAGVEIPVPFEILGNRSRVVGDANRSACGARSPHDQCQDDHQRPRRHAPRHRPSPHQSVAS